jgi:hypothetical protein
LGETFDTTLYAGLRLWQGAELWITPEIDQGFGFADTHGAAGFPTGDELCCRSRSNKTSAVKRGRRGDQRERDKMKERRSIFLRSIFIGPYC